MRPREAALAGARWLDQLEHAWVNISDAEKDELIYAVRRQLGLTSTATRVPVHHTMSASIIDSLANQTAAGNDTQGGLREDVFEVRPGPQGPVRIAKRRDQRVPKVATPALFRAAVLTTTTRSR
jgi:hypothetical protein